MGDNYGLRKKKYKEALERAKDVHTYYCDDREQLRKIESIFPELAEPKGERIREELIQFIKNWKNPNNIGRPHDFPTLTRNVKQCDRYIAWLEKQGEQPQGKLAVEAQNEDKVKPKFHEGDWVVYNNDICQIVKREEGCNKLVTVFGIEKELVNERNLSTARSWSIQDAKDGDVLADKYNNIGIFQECEDTDWYSYIYLRCDGEFIGFGCHEQTGTQPATKEQHDALYKAMADAGYEFDFEKKELKKIENKEVAYNPYKAAVESIANMCDKYKNRLYEIEARDFLNNIAVKCSEAIEYEKKYPQSTWSEEDETNLTNTIIMLKEGASHHFTNFSIVPCIDWLKQLKQRIGWKPSKGQLECLNYAIDKVEKDYNPLANNRIYLTLKALKEQLEKL